MAMEQNPVQPPQKSIMEQITPWKADTLWWIVVAEGVLALLIGIYFIVLPTEAGGRLIQLIGGYLLVTSVIAIYELMSHKGEPEGTPGRWIRVGIGLIVGLVALFYPMTVTIDAAAAATILALGLLIVGIMGIYAIIRTHAVTGWRWGNMIVYTLYVLLAVMVFYNNITGSVSRALPVLGWLLVLGGIALIGYGIWMYQRLSASNAAALAASRPVTDSEVSSATILSSESMASQPASGAPAPQASTTPPIKPAPSKSPTVPADGNGDDSKAVKP